jgi:short-subunit dehydrogenase
MSRLSHVDVRRGCCLASRLEARYADHEVTAVNNRKCVYIVGGSSGIGLALARVYVRAGDNVILLARNASKLEQAVHECLALAVDAKQLVAASPLDITAYHQLQAGMDAVVAEHGLPDRLILSAGVATNKTFLGTSREEFDWVMDVNFAGSREAARSVLPGMLARGSGQIAFISSSAGLVGLFGYSAYSASKFAVTGFVQALRQELIGTGVSINLVCPPEVATPMIAAEAATALPQTRFLKGLVGTLAPDVAASKIARGLRRNRPVVVPGIRASIVLWFERHFQAAFNYASEMLLRKFDV